MDGAAAETIDERAERQQIAAARKAIGRNEVSRPRRLSAALARLDQALATLPPAFDEQQAARQPCAGAAKEALAAAERAMLTAVRESQQLEEVSKQSVWLGERRESLRALRSSRG